MDSSPEGVSMGFGDLFGIGKKEEAPFRMPREITELRTSIEIEGRERYPSLARYKEITRIASSVYDYLDGMIAKKEHAEEAIRVREDIRKKLEMLNAKIQRNTEEANKEGKQDYVEKNIDYLQRKSMRNRAKTVFTEFLEEAEHFKIFCAGGRLEAGQTIESVSVKLFEALSELTHNFIQKHENDSDMQALKDRTLQKLSELDTLFREHRMRFREKGVETSIEANLYKYRKK
jgi:hypothetical protein